LNEIPLDTIECNPYNTRLRYLRHETERLASSLDLNGQLVPVRVRQSVRDPGKYELIYGHRRVMAARKLGWKTIRAEVVHINNEESMKQSLIENFERESLSDYEKAVALQSMHQNFCKTYEEIAEWLGISKQSVSNYVSMLKIFDPKDVSNDPELLEIVCKITEHHARLLYRIPNSQDRINLARMIVKERLSVRDLSRIVGRLRSWFDENESTHLLNIDAEDFGSQKEKEKVISVIRRDFELARRGDFNEFARLHLFQKGYSLYSAFPPFMLAEKDRAVEGIKRWFYEIVPKLGCQIKNVKASVFGDFALATLTVEYYGRVSQTSSSSVKTSSRGTVVLTKRYGSWKIMHEHFSPEVNTNSDSFQVTPNIADSHNFKLQVRQ
jgi:ParB family chromosome partitioning protein